jgi:hypothetical protein
MKNSLGSVDIFKKFFASPMKLILHFIINNIKLPSIIRKLSNFFSKALRYPLTKFKSLGIFLAALLKN